MINAEQRQQKFNTILTKTEIPENEERQSDPILVATSQQHVAVVTTPQAL